MKAYIIQKNLQSLEELPACLVYGASLSQALTLQLKEGDGTAGSNEAPDPNPTGNQVLVDVHCAGLNFFDILQVQGKYQIKPPFPYVPGSEFSGVIASTSPIPRGCPFIPGKTRVFGAGQGAYAEKLPVDWTALIEIPAVLSFEQASGLFITYPTSYAALFHRAQLKAGEWCLVHAGAGGVGLAAVQIAKAIGAKVIATASTKAKLDVIRREGGLDEEDHTILYTTGQLQAGGDRGKGGKAANEPWQDKVLEITKGKGVDVVYDPVGLLNKSIKVAGWNCRLLVIGFAAGEIEKIPANLLLLKNISVVGLHWGAWTIHQPSAIPGVWAALLELIKQGRLRPAVFDKVYNGLEDLPKGLEDLGKRRTWGKAVLRIRPAGSGGKQRDTKL